MLLILEIELCASRCGFWHVYAYANMRTDSPSLSLMNNILDWKARSQNRLYRRLITVGSIARTHECGRIEREQHLVSDVTLCVGNRHPKSNVVMSELELDSAHSSHR